MYSHGCRRNAIDNYVPSVGNRVTAFAAPRCGDADSGVFEDQIECTLYALADKRTCAQVFSSDVRKGIKVRL